MAEQRICPVCENEIPEDARFLCPNCHNNIVDFINSILTYMFVGVLGPPLFWMLAVWMTSAWEHGWWVSLVLFSIPGGVLGGFIGYLFEKKYKNRYYRFVYFLLTLFIGICFPYFTFFLVDYLN
jgi:hypothetical protein